MTSLYHRVSMIESYSWPKNLLIWAFADSRLCKKNCNFFIVCFGINMGNLF